MGMGKLSVSAIIPWGMNTSVACSCPEHKHIQQMHHQQLPLSFWFQRLFPVLRLSWNHESQRYYWHEFHHRVPMRPQGPLRLWPIREKYKIFIGFVIGSSLLLLFFLKKLKSMNLKDNQDPYLQTLITDALMTKEYYFYHNSLLA